MNKALFGIHSEVEFNSVDSKSVRIFIPDTLSYASVAHVNHIFQFDSNPHLLTIERSPNPNNDFREEYSAYCTKTGFTISKKSTEHPGEPGHPKVGYAKTEETYVFSKDTLRLSVRKRSYDLKMNLQEDATINGFYQKNKLRPR